MKKSKGLLMQEKVGEYTTLLFAHSPLSTQAMPH